MIAGLSVGGGIGTRNGGTKIEPQEERAALFEEVSGKKLTITQSTDPELVHRWLDQNLISVNLQFETKPTITATDSGIAVHFSLDRKLDSDGNRISFHGVFRLGGEGRCRYSSPKRERNFSE